MRDENRSIFELLGTIENRSNLELDELNQLFRHLSHNQQCQLGMSLIFISTLFLSQRANVSNVNQAEILKAVIIYGIGQLILKSLNNHRYINWYAIRRFVRHLVSGLQAEVNTGRELFVVNRERRLVVYENYLNVERDSFLSFIVRQSFQSDLTHSVGFGDLSRETFQSDSLPFETYGYDLISSSYRGTSRNLRRMGLSEEFGRWSSDSRSTIPLTNRGNRGYFQSDLTRPVDFGDLLREMLQSYSTIIDSLWYHSTSSRDGGTHRNLGQMGQLEEFGSTYSFVVIMSEFYFPYYRRDDFIGFRESASGLSDEAFQAVLPTLGFDSIPRSITSMALPAFSKNHSRFEAEGYKIDDIPEDKVHLQCPLSGQIFTDPVYYPDPTDKSVLSLPPVERDFIVKYITDHPEAPNPFNRCMLRIDDLVLNPELKKEADEFVRDMVKQRRLKEPVVNANNVNSVLLDLFKKAVITNSQYHQIHSFSQEKKLHIVLTLTRFKTRECIDEGKTSVDEILELGVAGAAAKMRELESTALLSLGL